LEKEDQWLTMGKADFDGRKCRRGGKPQNSERLYLQLRRGGFSENVVAENALEGGGLGGLRAAFRRSCSVASWEN